MWFLVSLVVKGAHTRLLGIITPLKYYYTQKAKIFHRVSTNFNFMRVGHFFSDS